MPSDYLCNLIVPGAAKSGTSSLHEYLNQHPKICMSRSKEPHHFCRIKKYELGAASHNELFDESCGVQVFGESSTGYMIWPDSIKKISINLDNPKIIMVLRDPVERAFSHYRWRFRLGLEKRSFMEAVDKDGFGYDPEKPDKFGYKAYLQFSQYSKYCPMWLEEFGRNNCLLVSSADLKNEPRKVVNECFSFLSLSSLESVDAVFANQTDTAPSMSSSTMKNLASLIPSQLKTSLAYQSLRRKLLVGLAPDAPRNMTSEEEGYVKEVLRDDIDYFNSTFSLK